MKNFCSNLISRKVLLVKSAFIGDHKSEIMTTNGIIYSNMSVLNLLNNACIRYASTLEGRIHAAKVMMNYAHKTPVIIAPNEIGAFPTTSYKNVDCVWIFNHLFSVNDLGNGISQIVFNNGIQTTVRVSKNVLLKQQQRLHTLLNIFSNLEREG
ncbi:competence protein ComK [Bacillus sp. FJAT-22090]|uniref:competence protein ComK n=1 Tax=Bacillus sp. FJAT-22090 TaxID=1581038 RepID=UPI001642C966|nr:competence protein ComK [Bacillus sp. FJAT-22090]